MDSMSLAGAAVSSSPTMRRATAALAEPGLLEEVGRCRWRRPRVARPVLEAPDALLEEMCTDLVVSRAGRRTRRRPVASTGS